MNRACSFIDCGRPTKGHGLCSTHLAQFKRTGGTWAINSRPRKRLGTCEFLGCLRPAHARELCQAHSVQRLRGIELHEINPRYTLEPGKWRCGVCAEQKPLEMFSPAQRGRTRKAVCKACHAKKMREWQRANPEKVRINRLRKFGIGPADYERLYGVQGGRCVICDRSIPHHITSGTGKGKGGVWTCIDHDHATGRVRGLLCNVCNVGLGAFADSVDLLAGAISYLTRPIETA